MTITRSHTVSTPRARKHASALGHLAVAATEQGVGAESVDVSIGGITATVPPEVAAAFGDVLEAFASGHGVVIGPVDDEVTTGQAAKMLGVSRTYLCSLVDKGEIPFRYVGTHRRIKVANVLEYAQRRRLQRRAELDELSRLTEAADLYENDF